ncbi:MAG: hydrogenase maturation protease [Candidatus Desulforudaceae bacterium]|nr:hydrogenase maturation protease [Bacillota bacterium]MBU4555075.1 hydrogenase maturation protease [Bacillota bacterium]MBV1770526.1 hydrogenase maturation protease [Desulforudis sp.]MDP3045485.1 hydrogenase maturation protease [Bacillota bacterium]
MVQLKNAVIVGLGNVTSGDMGAGSYVIEALSQENLGMNVDLADIGSEVFNLEVHLYQQDYAILVYALARGYPGGHISQLAYQELCHVRQGCSCGMRPVYERLRLVERFGIMPSEVTLIVIEPRVACHRLGLSKEVRPAIRKAVRLIKKNLEQRGFLSSSRVTPLVRYRLELLQMTI